MYFFHTKKCREKKSRIQEFGLQAPTNKVKNFVLDTNVLLHDPGCLNRFADNHICIPVDVLAELDKFKGEQSERGANARQVHRRLTELFSTGVAHGPHSGSQERSGTEGRC